MGDKKLTPCKGCEDRVPGCHGGCEKYRAFREELDRKKEERLDELKKDALFGDYMKRRSR